MAFQLRPAQAACICLVVVLVVVATFIDVSAISKPVLSSAPPPTYDLQFNVSGMALRYLCGKHGIEIGASTHNSFRLTNASVCEKPGAYANVDVSADLGRTWGPKLTPINLVSFADDLPFKNETFDYVLSSHVLEHAFDPIKTITEWLRVVRPGGHIFMIIPHKDRTFDRNRDITPLQELLDRYSGKLKVSDYGQAKTPDVLQQHIRQAGLSANTTIDDVPHVLLSTTSLAFTPFTHADHHHWTVWKTDSFLAMCKAMDWNVVEHADTDDKVGNGFAVVLQK